MAIKTENADSKIIIPSDPNFPTQNFDVSRNQSGLIVCRGKIMPDGQQNSGLVLTKNNGETKTESGLILSPANQSLVIATDEQTMEFNQPKTEEKPQRSSVELARALHNPYLFLAKEVEKVLKSSELPFLDVVIKNLKDMGKGSNEDRFYTSIVANRIKQTVKYHDKNTDSDEFIEKSTPGALEATCLTSISLLTETDFKGDYNLVVLDPLCRLLEAYRKQTQYSKELNEMPDLTGTLIETLDRFSLVPLVRHGIYSLLEQIKIPVSQQEELIKKMDELGDLDHPLSFQLTLAIADKNPTSDWISLQRERRENIFQLLTGSNQKMFDNYQQLLNLSQGLVYYGDPLKPKPGKVGIEVEFTKAMPKQLQEFSAADEDELPNEAFDDFEEMCHLQGLDSVWTVGYDQYNGDTLEYNKELRRHKDYLIHDFEYVKSLIDLSKWFSDHAREILSLHLHFDNERHPNSPIMGNLFYDNELDAVRYNGYGTWEVRALNLPRSKGRIHPARIADLIGLYLNATKEEK